MRLPLLVGLSALVLAPRAGAQAVTEQEFLSAFTQESTAVRALSEGVARAEAARRRAGLLPNPRVDFRREQPDLAERLGRGPRELAPATRSALAAIDGVWIQREARLDEAR